MMQPIGFFTWAYIQTKMLGIEQASWSLGLAIVLDAAVIVTLFLSIAELVVACSQ